MCENDVSLSSKETISAFVKSIAAWGFLFYIEIMKRCYRCWFVLNLIFLFAIGSLQTNAQKRVKGIPQSFKQSLKKAVKIPVLQLDSVHVQQMLEEDKNFSIDNRYGVIQSCDIDIKKAGIKTVVQNKGNIWQYQIESKDAFSLGLFFKTFNLPEGASLFIYNTSKSNLRGAFTSHNNNSGHRLPIAEFPENNLIIEYFEPSSTEFSGDLVIGSVSQAYVNFQSIAAARIGINCPQGDDWQEEKTCVCRMTFNDTRYSYFCTGALINNVGVDETPYFLTANHCISTESVANTLVTYFNYENSTCTSADASENQTLSGATLKSGSTYSDFSLLLLNEYPDTEYNAYYAGWDASGNSPDSGVCIHHPEGEPKCIAVDNDPIISDPSSTEWTDDTGKVISTTKSNTHWLAQFEVGNTESGSSGSPLFDQNKRIVGQLHGGSDTESLYGKFSLSWNYNSTYSKQLAHWLDPENTGTEILDGMGQRPPLANFSAELQEACVNTPVLFSDESIYNPSDWLWQLTPSSYSFANGTDSTSQNPQIVFLEDGIYSVTLIATNNYGSNELSLNNYILAKSNLNVQFLEMGTDSVVCGCDLAAFSMVASGAFTYNFTVEETELIDTKVSSDTLFLSLNNSANGAESFDTWVKVTGTHGSCSASDSILLHVIIQPNDNIAHASSLSLGRNSGYSNQCATVETKEPYPSSSGCLVANNWCPDQTADDSVLNNSIWFTFIAPSNGLLTINTAGFDDQIAVYDASSYSSILSGSSSQYTMVGANDNRSASDNTARIENLTLNSGEQYWLQLDGNNAVYGNVVIDLVSNSIEVYPNPSTGIFNLIISNPVNGFADVVVYDLQGRKLMEEKYYTTINSNKFTIDLSGYAKGMYLLNVQINGSNLSKKIIRH